MKRCKQIRLLIILFIIVMNANAQEPEQASPDSLGIIVNQNNTYLLPGEFVDITVIQACDSKYPMTRVSIGGMQLPFYNKGMAAIKLMGGSTGVHTVPVIVTYKDRNGLFKEKTYSVEYTVGQVATSVSLDNMNVLYIGIDNPVSIATSGAGDEKIHISIKGAGGRIVREGLGRYKVRVTAPSDDLMIYVSVDDKLVSASQFRARHLPVPVGTVGGHTAGDSVSVAAIKAQEGVSSYLKDFPIDIRYEVTGYSLTIQDDKGVIRSVACKGPRFSSEAKQLMSQYLKPGSIVTIGNLMAKDPGGRVMKLLPLIYFIK